jgi:hypothetical protein
LGAAQAFATITPKLAPSTPVIPASEKLVALQNEIQVDWTVWLPYDPNSPFGHFGPPRPGTPVHIGPFGPPPDPDMPINNGDPGPAPAPDAAPDAVPDPAPDPVPDGAPAAAGPAMPGDGDGGVGDPQ